MYELSEHKKFNKQLYLHEISEVDIEWIILPQLIKLKNHVTMNISRTNE